MNIEQAKKIPLVDLLRRLGCEIKRSERGGTELSYVSAWRTESTPSLYVNKVKNVWFDHGENEGGHTLDFAVTYLEKTGKPHSKKEALQWLSQTMGYKSYTFSFSSSSQKEISEPVEPSRDLNLIGVAPLKSKRIFEYLAGRGIKKDLAQCYFKLVRYQNTKKPLEGGYYGFGQKNIAGGYEVRSATTKQTFKSALIKRDITFHSGRVGEGVCVFEGMLDHLSLLAILNAPKLNNDTIILNGASCYARAKAYILEKGYEKIDLFLDNDKTGDKVTAKFIETFGNIATDHRHLYAEYKDMNEALQDGHDPTFGASPSQEP